MANNWRGASPLYWHSPAKRIGPPQVRRKPKMLACLDIRCDAVIPFDAAGRQSGYCLPHLKEFAVKQSRIYGGYNA